MVVVMDKEERAALLKKKKDKLTNLQYKQRVCTNHDGVLRYADLITKLRKEIQTLEA